MFGKIKIVSAVFLLIVLGSNMLSFAAQDRQKGKIFVNGAELEGEFAWFLSEEHEINDGCRRSSQVYETAELPFTAILKAYGFEVEWKDPGHARMTLEGRVFELDIYKPEVVEEGTSEDLLIPAPGGRRAWTVAEEELYLDDVTVKSFLLLANDDRVFVEVDRENLRVDITFDPE